MRRAGGARGLELRTAAVDDLITVYVINHCRNKAIIVSFTLGRRLD